MSALCERNANIVVTPSKRAVNEEVKVQTGKTAQQVVFGEGTAEEVNDLVNLFQALQLDTSLNDEDRQKKMAALMDLGDEATRALQQEKAKRTGVTDDITEPQETGEEEDAKEKEAPEATAEATAEQVEQRLTWWQAMKETLAFSWKPTRGAADDKCSDYDSEDEVVLA